MLHGLGDQRRVPRRHCLPRSHGHHDVAERRHRPCHRTELCRCTTGPIWPWALPPSPSTSCCCGFCRSDRHPPCCHIGISGGARPPTLRNISSLRCSWRCARHCRRFEQHARPAGKRARARLLDLRSGWRRNGSGISVRPLGLALAMEMAVRPLGALAAGRSCRCPACRRLACGGAVARFFFTLADPAPDDPARLAGDVAYMIVTFAGMTLFGRGAGCGRPSSFGTDGPVRQALRSGAARRARTSAGRLAAREWRAFFPAFRSSSSFFSAQGR